MKRFMSYLIFLSCFIVVTPLYAATQTLTTYYPAPQGNYKNMTVNDILTLPSYTACTRSGTDVAIANVAGKLEVCDASGTYTLTNTSLWVGSSTFMYPQGYSTENVGIGTNADPGYKLGVTGTFNATGNTTIGGTATIAGNTSITSTDSSFNVGLAVTGRILTGGASNTGGIYVNSGKSLFMGQSGSAIGFWNTDNFYLQVASGGNVGIGPSDNNPQATLDVQGTTNLNGNTTVNSGNLTVKNGTAITLCTSSANCGILEVARATDGNYYAVYGP